MNRHSFDYDRPVTGRWEPPPPTPGRLDFWRINALALDRLGDVLTAFLPVGQETEGAYWEGHHPARPIMVRVSLLTGAWAEPDTGRSGRDLVSLTAHLFGLKPGQAAVRLARFINVEVVAYA